VKWNVKELKVVDKLPVHYNIGHILSAEGDTVSPDGQYVVAMNKMSIDRFANIGPLYPQNFQLIGINGPKMKMLADMPIGIGEPHYAQMINSDKLKPMKVYPMGTNALTAQKDPHAVTPGKSRIERKGREVHVYMTAIRSHFSPDRIEVNEGDTVHLHLTSVEQAEDQVHGFTIDMYNINLSMEPGKHENVTFVADKPGVYPFYCTEFCSALHLEMAGYMLVKPKGKSAELTPGARGKPGQKLAKQ
ncbi:MAG TPA: cupredoxin domain-containing protein, partial [Aggregicoccus sp.]|nr:cupredoxin domain-containing protein [Aggregicoccus sp.]